jgi:hypothetical protein
MGMVLDGRSDIYAVGCLLYEMLSGRKAFPQDNAWECMHAHVHSKPAPFKQVMPDLKVPRLLEQITMQALAKDPQMRFADAEKLRSALQIYLSNRNSRPSWRMLRAAGIKMLPARWKLYVALGLAAVVLPVVAWCVAERMPKPVDVAKVQAAKMRQLAWANKAKRLRFGARTLRYVQFPTNFTLGKLTWRPNHNGRDVDAGDARGPVQVPFGGMLSLEVDPTLEKDPSRLSYLPADVTALLFNGSLMGLDRIRQPERVVSLECVNVHVTKEAAAAIARLHNLDCLRLSACSLDDGAMAMVARNCPKMDWLILSNMQMHSADLDAIGTFKLLQGMWLSSLKGLDAKSLQQLSNCERMRYLSLRQTDVAGGVGKAIKSMPRLEYLGIYQCQLCDGDIAPLSACKSLRWCEMLQVGLSDACLPTFAKISTLESVRLSGTKVTEARFSKFQKLSPALTIFREGDVRLSHDIGH